MTPPRVVLDREALHAVVARLAAEVSAAYPEGFLAVAVLKGAVPFLADLVRRLTVPVEIDFLALSSFAPHSGRVRIVKDLEADVVGRDVLVVEDVVETGLSLTYLVNELGRRGARSIEVCALLDKDVRRIVPTPIRFRGIAVGDEFLLGYGLDHEGRYRNLDAVVAGDVGVLSADPDAYVKSLYRG